MNAAQVRLSGPVYAKRSESVGSGPDLDLFQHRDNLLHRKAFLLHQPFPLPQLGTVLAED
jgi:hypothetical protein